MAVCCVDLQLRQTAYLWRNGVFAREEKHFAGRAKCICKGSSVWPPPRAHHRGHSLLQRGPFCHLPRPLGEGKLSALKAAPSFTAWCTVCSVRGTGGGWLNGSRFTAELCLWCYRADLHCLLTRAFWLNSHLFSVQLLTVQYFPPNLP